MNYPKKVNAISTKGLTKDLINKFSTTNIDPWKSNGMSEEIIENITKSESSFVPTFVKHHLFPDITF